MTHVDQKNITKFYNIQTFQFVRILIFSSSAIILFMSTMFVSKRRPLAVINHNFGMDTVFRLHQMVVYE